jgi:hypothetical protein
MAAHIQSGRRNHRCMRTMRTIVQFAALSRVEEGGWAVATPVDKSHYTAIVQIIEVIDKTTTSGYNGKDLTHDRSKNQVAAITIRSHNYVGLIQKVKRHLDVLQGEDKPTSAAMDDSDEEDWDD